MAQVPATQRDQGGRLSTRWEHPLERFRRDFDNLFGSMFLSPFEQEAEALRLWDFSVKENDKEVIVRAEVPGFEPDELDVQLSNGVLTIKAEKEQKGNGAEEYRSFFRSVTLPPGTAAENVKANYRNGVLEVRVPREEGARAKHITIEGQRPEPGSKNQPESQAQQKGQTHKK
jgi:HSP20 family protein